MFSIARRELYGAAALAAGAALAVPVAAAVPSASAASAVKAAATAAAGHHQAASPARDVAGPRGSDPTITVNLGGVRPSATAAVMDGIPGVTYRATGVTDPADTGTCTTTAASPTSCTISVTSAITQAYTVAPLTVPAGWFDNPGLGVSTTTPPPATNPATAYDTFTTGALAPGGATTVPTNNAATASATARGSQVAFSRLDEREPTVCGLKVALVFDLSSSITGAILPTYLAAGQSFVSTLEGTPSSVAVYTFGTSAPAAGANNATLLPTAVNTAAGADVVRSHIAGLTVPAASYTNWDAALWQVAVSGEHYDAVIMLTDGDPTRYGRPSAVGLPGGVGVWTRFVDVENGIFSANAVKSETGTSLAHEALLAVGIDVPSPGSMANLRSISGPDDFFSTDFSGLAGTLDSLARGQCDGTVNVTKLTVPYGQPDAAGTPTSGWEFHSTHPAETALTDDNGVVSFHTGDSTADTTITETPRAGYTPIPSRTSCRNTVTGATVDITHVTNGFAVTPDPNGIIACEVYNERAPAPAISIEKTAFPTEFGVAGEEITYTFEVRNTGNTPLSGINVRDNHLGDIVCPRDQLGVGESMTCHFDYFTTEEDVAAGRIHNVVTVTGHDPEGTVVTDDDDATVTHIAGPGIQLEKVAFPAAYAVPGEVITYTYRVVNTGTSTLHDVTLTDSRLGRVPCPLTVLEPGEEMECTGAYAVTAADVAAGSIHNVATVTGQDPEGRLVDDTDDATVTAVHGPGIQIEKVAAPGTFSAAGQLVTYTYKVANTGNVTLHNISVTDSKAGTVTNCGSTILAPGQETTCTATYVTTVADVERGYIPNFAFARGYQPDGSSITSERAEAIVTSSLPEVPVTG